MHEAIAWVRANAMPLASVEAGHGFADLEPLRHIIGDARIVSLGEATHGTREFFQLKHRLLEFCVSELGFTVFGIEASYPECLRINDYVLAGAGNPTDALAGQRFWTWDTEEVLALVEWMRAWNRTHARKVKFYGFDMQFPTEAALGVLDYLKRVAPDLAAASAAPLWPLCDDISADRLHLLSEATRDAALAATETVVETFGREGLAWVAASSEIEWQLARMNAVVLHQSARLQLARSNAAASISRDVAMAENVRALLELEGPEAKAVLWAHNGHARRTAYVTDDKTVIATMGSRLHELFGRQQVVVGFAFNQGSFQAVQGGVGLIDHTAPPAPEGSLDHVLAAAAMPACLLNLAAAPATGAVADWLAGQPLSRWIGAVYSSAQAERFLQACDPRALYDVLAFVETTTAARPNAAGRRTRLPDRQPASTATNLDLAGSGDAPDGWDWSAGQHVYAHRLVLSDGPSPSGGRSLRIARQSAPWRWGQGRLEQTFSAEAWRGKRLRFSAAMCAEAEGPGTAAHLYIEVRPKQPEGMAWAMPASALAITEPRVRCTHWKTYAVELLIAEDAQTIVIGLALAGTGAAWFADLKLETC
ncbi:MAG: erythromycin esterase family protein [Hyphomicrobiaceae bacterium]